MMRPITVAEWQEYQKRGAAFVKKINELSDTELKSLIKKGISNMEPGEE